MLVVVLLLAHARAEWVEITQLRKPSGTGTHDASDIVEFHHDKTKPLLLTDHLDLYDEKRFNDQFSPVPNEHYDGKRFKVHMTTENTHFYDEKNLKSPPPMEPIDFYNEKRFPIQFSTEPGFLADYKRNRIYINHTIDNSSEKHWNKGVVHRVPNPTTSVKRVHVTTEEPAKVKYEETDLAHELNREYTMRNPFKPFLDKKPEFVTKEETFEDDGEDELHFVRKPPEDIWAKNNEIKLKNHSKDATPIRRVDTNVDNPVTHQTPFETFNDKDQSKETSESDAKVNTMENVLKFAKVVADTISRNTRRGVNSKLRYLEDLKDTILVNIEDRIESLWPDEADGTTRRRRWARSAEARGHVEFPSSESALMTISFLTFAVYLIKLVLQVIQTYKNKTMMVTPAVFAAVGRAASAGNGKSLPSSP